MRLSGLVLVAAIGILVGQGVAQAEKVKTNQSTKLYARPGEQAKVVLTVKSGQSMTLLDQDGRWLKVRVKGRTGYVPRSKVDMADDDGIARNTRRRPFVDGRGKKRGFGGSAPEDRIGADATEDQDRDEEDDDDDAAPPPKKKVAAKTPPKSSDDDEDEDEEDDEAPPPKKQVAVKATPSSSKEDDDDDEDEDGETSDEADDDDEEDEDDEDADDQRPRARVAKKAIVRYDPDDESEEAFVVVPTDILYPGETDGRWTFVENDAGDAGWIETDMLELGVSTSTGGGKRAIEVRVRTGLKLLRQAIRSTASANDNVPDNYDVKTSTVTASFGGGIMFPRGKLLFGAELAYDLSKTLLGGVPYENADQNIARTETGLTIHNVNVRALAGLDFKKPSGMALIGRLGYRYQGFLVDDVVSMTANPARLPSEVIKGPTVGAALVIPYLRSKLGLRVSLDAMLFGASVTQTRGLEDGSAPTAKSIVLGAGVTYHLAPTLDLQATYDLDYMGVDFGAPLASSQRMHMGTSLKRTDIFHMITFGIAKPF